MRRSFRFLAIFGSFAAGVAVSQSAAGQVGVAPAWDMRATLQSLVDQTGKYKALVDQIRTEEWTAKGAPEGYTRHRELVKREVGYLGIVAGNLKQNPEKLSLALDAFFRLQTLESFTQSLADGAKRYQSEQLAGELSGVIAENESVRSKLRQYVLDLSVTKEAEYTVAEKEAQRCQAILNRNPLAPEPKIYTAPAPKPATK